MAQKSMLIRQVLGVDVSSKTLDICFKTMDSTGQSKILWSKKFDNTIIGIEDLFVKLKSKLKENGPILTVVMESTGIYHENLAYMAHDLGFTVKIVLGGRMHYYAKSLNFKLKTDKIDAQIIAQYGLERSDYEQNWEPASPLFRAIRLLSRERLMLIKDITRLKNRLHALNKSNEAEPNVIKRLEVHIEFMENQLNEVVADLKKEVKNDTKIKSLVERLCTINGVGFITAVTVLAETNCFEQFNSMSQLVCYAGYDIVIKQSGTSVNSGGRISKKGNSKIRAVMHMAALTAVNKNVIFEDLKNRIKDKTQKAMKGYVAVQRKLLTIMYTLVKNGENYDFEKHLRQSKLEQSVISN